MSDYHTRVLANADIFTVMGSIYAEIARYDSALASEQVDTAMQAAERTQELIHFSSGLKQLNKAQKMEIKELGRLFAHLSKTAKKSELDGYLLPFAVAQRLRQFS